MHFIITFGRMISNRITHNRMTFSNRMTLIRMTFRIRLYRMTFSRMSENGTQNDTQNNSL
jgi:hypothetical protein